MANKEVIFQMLKDLQSMLNIKGKVHLELRPMKTKAASVSLKRRVIRLSKDILLNIDKKTVKYLILHELVHLKLHTIHHTKDFYNIIYNIITEDEIQKLEKNVLKKLIALNKKAIQQITK